MSRAFLLCWAQQLKPLLLPNPRAVIQAGLTGPETGARGGVTVLVSAAVALSFLIAFIAALGLAIILRELKSKLLNLN